MNFWTIARLLLRFWPLVTLAVRAVEDASDGWTSEEKQQAAQQGILKLAASFGLTLPQDFVDNLPRIIDAIVSVFNAVGAFRKREHGPKAEQPA
jgi:hypothetical protein